MVTEKLMRYLSYFISFFNIFKRLEASDRASSVRESVSPNSPSLTVPRIVDTVGIRACVIVSEMSSYILYAEWIFAELLSLVHLATKMN